MERIILTNSEKAYNIVFSDTTADGYATWNFDGTKQIGPAIFDIIRIEPKPFDWKDVKPGMAFYSGPHPNGSVTRYRYIKPSSSPERVVCDIGVGSYSAPRKSDLHRLDEHDIEAQS